MENIKNKKETKYISDYKLIFGYLGIFLILISAVLLLPFFSLFKDLNDYIYIGHFLLPASICFLIGEILFIFLLKGKTGKLRKNQDMILLLLIWISAILFGSIPFLIKGESFTKSIFEITSGFTTTGFEIFDLKNMPKIFIFYRSIANFFGGVGLVLILASAINLKYGVQLYKAEGHEGFVPSLIKSSKIIMIIYSYFILIGTLLFVIFGMDFFDAINHSISSIATGGFSTVNESLLGYKDSNYYLGLQTVAIFLMIIGSTNFLIFYAIYKMQFKKVFKNSETIYDLLSFTIFSVIVLLYAKFQLGISVSNIAEYGIFQYVSASSTTGLTNFDISKFSDFFIFVLLIKMIVGGQVGSTSGGIKKYRIAYVLQGLFIYITKPFKDSNIISTNYVYVLGKKVVFKEDEYKKNLNYVILYFIVILIGSLLFILGEKQNLKNGILIRDSLFNITSALGTVGLSTSNLQTSSNFQIWILTLTMFLGRLEIIPIFVALKRGATDLFSKKKEKVIYNNI